MTNKQIAEELREHALRRKWTALVFLSNDAFAAVESMCQQFFGIPWWGEFRYLDELEKRMALLFIAESLS